MSFKVGDRVNVYGRPWGKFRVPPKWRYGKIVGENLLGQGRSGRYPVAILGGQWGEEHPGEDYTGQAFLIRFTEGGGALWYRPSDLKPVRSRGVKSNPSKRRRKNPVGDTYVVTHANPRGRPLWRSHGRNSQGYFRWSTSHEVNSHWLDIHQKGVGLFQVTIDGKPSGAGFASLDGAKRYAMKTARTGGGYHGRKNPGYSDSNPKIDLYYRSPAGGKLPSVAGNYASGAHGSRDWSYHSSTKWSRTVREAVATMRAKMPQYEWRGSIDRSRR